MRHDKSATGEVLTSNDEHTSLLNTLSDAVIFLDKEATILFVNESATAIVGTSEHELIGKTLWQAAPQLISIAFYQAVVDVIRTHIPSQVKYPSPVTHSWLCVYFSPTAEGVVLFFHEEAELIIFQDPIRQSARRQLEILEAISERVAILTPQGLLLEINQRPLNDARVQREEVIGKPFAEFPLWIYSPVTQEKLRTAIVQASRGETVRFETKACLPVEQYVDLVVTLSPHRDENQQVDYLICAGQDITEHKQVEASLRDLLDVIPHNVWIAQPDGSVIYDNQRLVSYLAIANEQVEADDWMTRVHLDDLPRVQEAWYTSIHTGQPYEAEYRLQDSIGGAYHWVLTRGVPQRNEQGKILSWIGTATDIDTQKQAEERIKASEQDLRVLTETFPHLVWAAQPDGRIDYINQRCYDFMRTDFSQIHDFRWHQFLHPDDMERVTTHRTQTVAAGEIYEDEYRLRNGRTGEYHWFLSRSLPVRDDTGQIIKWFGTGTDISEQKRTEEALRQCQKREHALMASDIIGVILSEGDVIIEANDTFLHMTGYRQEDLEQRRLNWVHMTASEYSAITEQAHQQLMLDGYMTPYEKEYVCKDGTHLSVLVGGVMTQIESLQMICFVLDNSARKELEQRKDDFLSMASHELRTPLTSLRLQTQMLRRQLVKQSIHTADAAFARMEGQLNALTRLVEELFDISKIQAGKLEYAQETVDLNELLQETVEVMQQTQKSHNIVMSGPAYPTFLIGDRDRLGQVFLNLISNAIKYSPDANQVEVDMTTSAEVVMISVRDRGIGIPREQHEKIFERFYRAVPQNQSAFPGLGMGLSIVLEIVKHHKGTITVESEVGIGSTFQMMLPRQSL